MSWAKKTKPMPWEILPEANLMWKNLKPAREPERKSKWARETAFKIDQSQVVDAALLLAELTNFTHQWFNIEATNTKKLNFSNDKTAAQQIRPSGKNKKSLKHV